MRINAMLPSLARSSPAIAALLALACSVFVFGPSAAAQGEVQLELQSAWGGRISAIEPQGNTVYIGTGRRLVILDIVDDPKSGGVDITELGSVDLGRFVHDIKVRDGYAYVALMSRPLAFAMVDVSDLQNPVIVWGAGTEEGIDFGREVELYNDFAFVGMSAGDDIKYVRVRDPLTGEPLLPPQVLGSEGVGKTTMIQGNKLYTIDADNGIDGTPVAEIKIIELAPGIPLPTLLGTAVLPGDHHPMAAIVDGNYVYAVSQYEDGVFAVFDVSDPANPVLRGSIPGMEINSQGFGAHTEIKTSSMMASFGDFVFVTIPRVEEGDAFGGSRGVVVINVSDPDNPVHVDTWTTHSNRIERIVIDGTRAYLADDGEGLLVLDITDPLNPVRLGAYHSAARIIGIDKVGSNLFVSDESNGITILDVSNLDAPQLVGTYQTAEDAVALGNVVVRNGLAYLATGLGGGLDVVDVSDPTRLCLKTVVSGTSR